MSDRLFEHIDQALSESLGLNEARDPNQQAHDLIRDSRGLLRELDSQRKDVEKALKSANKQLDGLKKVGSDVLSAPSVLAGEPLRALKSARDFLNDVVDQIEDLEKHGR